MRSFFRILFFLPILLFSDQYLLDLGSLGSVCYLHQDGRLLQVNRLSLSNELLYSHSYQYNEDGVLVSEELIGGLGEVVYGNGVVLTPYSREEIFYDQEHIQYRFDDISYDYVLNGEKCELCRKTPIYDDRGRVIQIGDTCLEYNDHDQLIKVSSSDFSVKYGYNDEGFRNSREIKGEIEHFLHLGLNEYAIMDGEGCIKELRIPGLSFHPDILCPIAIETPEAIYAPIHDLRGNIVKLVNIFTKEVITLTQPGPFGHNIAKESPTSWIFSHKHYDPVTNLVYFGYRYYSPDIEEWITPDPLIESSNLYTYCSNNPFFFTDPDGRSDIAINVLKIALGGTAVISSPLWTPGALLFAGAAALTYGGSKVYKNYREYQRVERSKKGGIDPTLPKDPFQRRGWEDISHPDAKEEGHYRFRDRQTGEIIEFDRGKPGRTGHKSRDHYHRPNPSSKGDGDKYLDADRNPTPNGSDASHLYPSKGK